MRNTGRTSACNPGGDRHGDFVRVGLPLDLLLWVAATILIPMIWAF